MNTVCFIGDGDVSLKFDEVTEKKSLGKKRYRSKTRGIGRFPDMSVKKVIVFRCVGANIKNKLRFGDALLTAEKHKAAEHDRTS